MHGYEILDKRHFEINRLKEILMEGGQTLDSQDIDFLFDSEEPAWDILALDLEVGPKNVGLIIKKIRERAEKQGGSTAKILDRYTSECELVFSLALGREEEPSGATFFE